jgi:MFS family permease
MTTMHDQRTRSSGGADTSTAEPGRAPDDLERRTPVGKVAFASAIGATIEWYDFFLYGAAAGLVFDQLYFGNFGDTMATVLSFATFAVGFIARPVGSLIFGHFGDRIGRKQMLILTLFIMGISTTVIGLIPTQASIGLWAPLALILMRVLQGIGVGGEYGGAVLMAVEYAEPRRRGFFGSWAHVGVPAGLLLASGAFLLASLLPEDAFLAWGWRACFLASTVLLAIGAWVRLSVMETPVFEKVRQHADIVRVPFAEVVTSYWRSLLLAMGTRWIEGLTFNLYAVHLLAYATKTLELSRTMVLGGTMLGALVGSLVVPIAGSWSDRVGRNPVFHIGVLLSGLLTIPSVAMLHSGHPWVVWSSMVIGLGLLYGIICAPLAAFWAELFDTRVRYTAIGSVYQLSGIVASGLTPLIAALLVSWNGGNLWYVAAYTIGVALVSFLCASALPETVGRDLNRPLRKAPGRSVPVEIGQHRVAA